MATRPNSVSIFLTAQLECLLPTFHDSFNCLTNFGDVNRAFARNVAFGTIPFRPIGTTQYEFRISIDNCVGIVT